MPQTTARPSTRRTSPRATCVMAWSEPTQSRHGDEYLVHSVALCDDSGDPVGKVYTSSDPSKMFRLASNMARDRRLELVTDEMIYQP